MINLCKAHSQHAVQVVDFPKEQQYLEKRIVLLGVLASFAVNLIKSFVYYKGPIKMAQVGWW